MHPGHGRVGLDEGDRRRSRPGSTPRARRPSPSSTSCPRSIRVGIVAFASRAGHAGLADRPTGPSSRPPSTASGRATGRPWATRSCRSSTSPSRSRPTAPRRPTPRRARGDPPSRPSAHRLRAPDASACPRRPDGRAVEPAARRRDPAVRRRQLGRRDRAARRGATGPPRSGVPIYTIALGTPNGTVAGPRRPRPARDPRRAAGHGDARSRSPRSPAATAFDAPTAEDLPSVYDNLESRIGYTEERQEVTFALVGAGLLLVVLGAGLSAVWFGRLP